MLKEYLMAYTDTDIFAIYRLSGVRWEQRFLSGIESKAGWVEIKTLAGARHLDECLKHKFTRDSSGLLIFNINTVIAEAEGTVQGGK